MEGTPASEKADRGSPAENANASRSRVFLKDAPIVLIDEAASALDPENEHAISQAITQLAADPGRTVIVIAHRPATLRAAHRVTTLDGGRVIENDTPAHLRTTGGLHSRLYHRNLAANTWQLSTR